eukprot:1152015-Pelagomonas_calceolata.AAC.7
MPHQVQVSSIDSGRHGILLTALARQAFTVRSFTSTDIFCAWRGRSQDLATIDAGPVAARASTQVCTVSHSVLALLGREGA